MSNRRRLRAGFEDWRVRCLTSGLTLLAASGCGESSTEIDGVWVDVIVGCGDPHCIECGPVSARRRPHGGLPPEDAPSDTEHAEAVWMPRRSIR